MGDPRRLVLVTGASAGIGWAFAEVFAENGFDVALVARRSERLEELAGQIESRWGVQAHVMPADLADPGTPARLEASLAASGRTVDVLVNNAGYGLNGSFVDIPWERQRDFLQVLMLAPAELCRRFLPGMRARGWGRVINVASTAALVPPRPGDSYSATKAFLVRLSKSLALEYRGTGVHVTALCPGYTRSEFHAAMGIPEHADRLPGLFWLTSEQVARQGYEASMRGKRVYINGWINRVVAALAAVIPDSVVYALAPRGVLERHPGRRPDSAPDSASDSRPKID